MTRPNLLRASLALVLGFVLVGAPTAFPLESTEAQAVALSTSPTLDTPPPPPPLTANLAEVIRSLPVCERIDVMPEGFRASPIPLLHGCRLAPTATGPSHRSLERRGGPGGPALLSELVAGLLGVPVAQASDRGTVNPTQPRHGNISGLGDVWRASIGTPGTYYPDHAAKYNYGVFNSGGNNYGSYGAIVTRQVSGTDVALGSFLHWFNNGIPAAVALYEAGWISSGFSGVGCGLTPTLYSEWVLNGVGGIKCSVALQPNVQYAIGQVRSSGTDWASILWNGTQWVGFDVQGVGSASPPDGKSSGLDPGLEGHITSGTITTTISDLHQTRDGSAWELVGSAPPPSQCNNPPPGQQCAFAINNQRATIGMVQQHYEFNLQLVP